MGRETAAHEELQMQIPDPAALPDPTAFPDPAVTDADPISRIPVPSFLHQSVQSEKEKAKSKEPAKGKEAAKDKEKPKVKEQAGPGKLKDQDPIAVGPIIDDSVVTETVIEPHSAFVPFAVLSPSFRNGSNETEHRGFIPEAWFGAVWHDKVFSARVSACISCHSNKIDPVEVAVRVDFSEWIQGLKDGTRGGIEAGRFIVPFSAFSAAPMEYRTVARPLIFSMGQLVHANLTGQAVLPMPFTDTGINVNVNVPVGAICDQPVPRGLGRLCHQRPDRRQCRHRLGGLARELSDESKPHGRYAHYRRHRHGAHRRIGDGG